MYLEGCVLCLFDRYCVPLGILILIKVIQTVKKVEIKAREDYPVLQHKRHLFSGFRKFAKKTFGRGSPVVRAWERYVSGQGF